MVNNYNNGKIYKIVPNVANAEEGDVYVGSTTKVRLCQRMTAHRGDYDKWKKGKHNKTASFDLFDKYGIENCNIILLELINCNSRNELHALERYYIESIKCVNKVIPSRTIQEWRCDNKDKLKEQMKEYYEVNQEKIKEQIKEYYEANKNKIMEHKKQYYQKTKEQKLKPFVCECGSICCYCGRSKHFKTQKHQDYLKQKVEDL